MFSEGTLIFSTTPPRCSEKWVTVTLLFRSESADVFASVVVAFDRSKTGEAGGVLKVIREAAAAAAAALFELEFAPLVVLAVVVALGDWGERLSNVPTATSAAPLRFNVNLSPPYRRGWTMWDTKK